MRLSNLFALLIFRSATTAEWTVGVDIASKKTGTPGCSKPLEFPAEAGGPSKGIQIGERRVRITLPTEYKQDVPAPLVIAFHDKNMTMEEMEQMTHLSDSSLNPNTIILYPEALENNWISDPDSYGKGGDKVFIASLLDGISQQLCIDTDRIYATGLGFGGGLAHLLACDPLFSKRISAFALVNPAIYGGLDDKLDVKDEFTMLWEKCKPARVPIRIMEIHSGDNMINKYRPTAEATMPGKPRRTRLPIVQWLVKWAMRNECGPARGSPKRESEIMYSTPLHSGSLGEGWTELNKLQQASYRCHEAKWDAQTEGYLDALGLADVDDIESSSEKEIKATEDDRDAKDTSGSSQDSERASSKKGEQKKRGVLCLMHYVVKNIGHGWPRVVMTDGSTVPLGPDSTEAEDAPIFDATTTILDWFKQHKLSDESREPKLEPKLEPEAEPESNDDALEKLISELKAKIDAQTNAAQEQEDSAVETEDLKSNAKSVTETEAGEEIRAKDEL